MTDRHEGAGRIRVLQVLEATAGGTRKHLVSLLGALDRDSFEVEVAGPPVRDGHDLDTRFGEDVADLGVRLHPVAMRRQVSPVSDLRAVLELSRIMRRGRYDVVHLHSSKAGVLGRIAAKLSGIKTVYTPNGFYFLNAEGRVARSFYLAVERFAGLLTDRLVAVSESERAAILEARVVADRKVVVIPNAIEADELAADSAARDRVRTELGIPSDAFVLGTVSRFIRQKDPLTMIRMIREVQRAAPEVHFVWCGEGGDLEPDTMALVDELGSRERLHFTGFRHDVHDVMNAFDVFVLSSIFEGLPYALLEAMFLELPVVATDVVGSRDVVMDGETGVLTPPGDPAALAEGVLRLVRDDQLRRTLADSARRMVEERHAISSMIARVEDVYRSLAC